MPSRSAGFCRDGCRPASPCCVVGRGFVNQVISLIGNLDPRPIVTTSYQCEVFIGREADLWLRVTIDHRVHGRDHIAADPISPDAATILDALAVTLR